MLCKVLSDDKWKVLKPLLDQCRPKGKTEPLDLQRTVSGILYRLVNGTSWRSLPQDIFGPWERCAQLFIRWGKIGVWDQFFSMMRESSLNASLVSIDGTNIRAHHKSSGAQYELDRPRDKRKKQKHEALGRSRGGFGTKICAIVNEKGRAIGLTIAPGQDHELPYVRRLLKKLPRPPLYFIGDKAYNDATLRQDLYDWGTTPVIPTRKNQRQLACPEFIYRLRHKVENFWARIKEWRAVATRYEKTATSYLSVVCLAAAFDYLKGNL